MICRLCGEKQGLRLRFNTLKILKILTIIPSEGGHLTLKISGWGGGGEYVMPLPLRLFIDLFNGKDYKSSQFRDFSSQFFYGTLLKEVWLQLL